MFKTFTNLAGGEVDIVIAMIVSVRDPLPGNPQGSVIFTADSKFVVVKESRDEIRAMLNEAGA
jgi:hypothetical protein